MSDTVETVAETISDAKDRLRRLHTWTLKQKTEDLIFYILWGIGVFIFLKGGSDYGNLPRYWETTEAKAIALLLIVGSWWIPPLRRAILKYRWWLTVALVVFISIWLAS